MDISTTIERIRAAVVRLDRRVRTQRMLQAVVTASCWAILLGVLVLSLFKTGWISASHAMIGLELLVVIPGVAAIWSWTRPLNIIELAQQVDRTHAFHDRLSTALYLGEKGVSGPFEEAQVADAAGFIERVDIKLAAPMPRLADGVLLGVLAIVFAGIWLVKPPSHQKPLPPPFVIKHDSVLDAATLALERDRLESIKKMLETSEEPEAKELVREIEELLNKVENQEISDKQFLKELDRLEKKFFDKEGKDEVEKLADALKAAAEKLEKEAKSDLKKEPEAQKLVDALKDKDMQKAAEALEALSKKLNADDMSAKDLERLARLMEKFADAIDLDDPMLKKLMEENEELVKKLQELFDKDGLTEAEKQRLNRAKQKQKDMKKKRDASKKSKHRRSLEQLRRKTKEMAENAKKAATQKKQGKGKKGKEEAEKEASKFKQEAGRQAKEMSKKLEEQAKDQEKSQAKRMAQKQLEEMREAMQRSSKNSDSPKKEGQEQQRAEKIKEYLDRAKGKQPKDGELGKDGQPMPEGESKKDGAKMKGGEGQADKEGKGKAPPVPDGKKTDIAGKGEGDRTLSDETKLDAKRKDEQLKGREGKGPSRSEVIKSASEEGFANTAYKDVYVDYESVVEEVMDKESVPAGYRFYVKRYFQLIKPQE